MAQRKFLDQNGLLYFWGKIKQRFATKESIPTKISELKNDDSTVKDANYSNLKIDVSTTKEQVKSLIDAGAQPNIIETVAVNDTNLTPDANKKVNITITSGSANGTISANGIDVHVKGLGSAAYTASSAYDAAGAATKVLGTEADTIANVTVYGAIAKADAAQKGVNDINKAGYQTAANVKTTVESYGYQTSSQVQAAINDALNNASGIDFQIVTELPTTGKKGTFYLIADTHSDRQDNYDEYIYANGAWQKIGNTDVDLSAYQKTEDLIKIENSEIDQITSNRE